MIGSSHTNRLSALVPASLETEYLKLPSQSQTNVEQRFEQLAISIASFGLSPGYFVYIDALSNQIFMGSDEDGLPVEPKKDGSNAWHISGSLTVAPKPRVKKLLNQLECLKEACGGASLVCGLPLARYVRQKCCHCKTHLDNFGEDDYEQILLSAATLSKVCLSATFPGATIFDPMESFATSETGLADLHSSAGVSIWSDADPVHLTNAAYGDIAASLVKLVSSTTTVSTSQPRNRLESVVTRQQLPEEELAPVPGWIMGENRRGGRGRGGLGRGFGGQASRGGRPTFVRGGQNRWAPY